MRDEILRSGDACGDSNSHRIDNELSEIQVVTPSCPNSIFGDNGRAGEIRTHDLLHPMQAFYQAELRPDLMAEQLGGCSAGAHTLMRGAGFATDI